MATPGKADARALERKKRRIQAWERDLRLWSGLVLLVFLAMHLANHALGVFGLGILEIAQDWRLALWRTWPGQILLYGAALVHVVLVLKRISNRRTLRMPRDEAVQIISGLVIPLLLVDHVAGTRLLGLVAGAGENYGQVLPRLYAGRPVLQTLLVVVAWTHGCVGFYHAYRWKPWFRGRRTALLLAAILLPALALAGFAAAGREAVALNAPQRVYDPALLATLHALVRQINMAFAAAIALTALVIGLRALRRRRSGFFTIRYTGHGAVKMSRGTSILEASRISHIPHPSRCGGRARCATCRVLVVSSDAPLPPPGKAERALLQRIDAPPQVRLACQVRPTANVTVQVLLPFLAAPEHSDPRDDEFKWSAEHDITVLFVNIRGFNLMAQRLHPQDLVLLLNRFSAEMTQAVEAYGGRVNTHLTDGVMAIFGLDGAKDAGSSKAIGAARCMLGAIRELDSELADVLAMPLRVGIGVHTGTAVLARFGDKERGQRIGALGEIVSIADRIEGATKALLADCLISDETLKRCGLRLATRGPLEISIPGRDAPLVVHALGEAQEKAAAA